MGVININNEYLLSTNNFREPRVLENRDSCAILLMRLLLLEPGSIPEQPEMGIGIITRYLFADLSSIDQLRLDIQKQVSIFLPELIAVTVQVYMIKKELRVQITVDGVLYSFDTDASNKSLSVSNL